MTGPKQHLSDRTIERLAEGALTAAERTSAEAHLEHCARCATELEGYRALFAALEGLPRFAPAEGFADAVMVRVHVAPEPSPLWTWLTARRPTTRRGWTLLGAVLLAPALPVLAGVLWLLTHPTVSAAPLRQSVWAATTATAGDVLSTVFEWSMRSGLFGYAQMTIDLATSTPLTTLAAVAGVFAVAIPLSAWSLFRLIRGPTQEMTYAN